MKREALEALQVWRQNPERKPLIVRGARQVGKTWLMREFGRAAFAKTAYVSFFNNPGVAAVFDESYSRERILMGLSAVSGVDITAGDTLIILDEIQEQPRALEALKFFAEEMNDYPVVAAGSLLGVALHSGLSFPVGKVEFLDLYPLSFSEFLNAMGQTQLAELLATEDWKLIGAFSAEFELWLKNYMYVGGMPEVVEFFSQSNDYGKVRALQRTIVEQYQADFSKHIPAAQSTRTRMVWNSIPAQLAKENKKFVFRDLKPGGRLKDFELSIEWLVDSGLLTRVFRVSKPAVPLKAFEKQSVFKLYLGDVGLLGALSDFPAAALFEGDSVFTEFTGALAEQFVVQELVATSGITPYYFATDSGSYKVDFLIQDGVRVIPVEVKSGTNRRATSLNYYRDKFNPELSIRFSVGKFAKNADLMDVPLYAVSALKNIAQW